ELERRSAFLAEVSATLASSLEPAETLATAAHLAVHHFADWCMIELSEEGGGAVAGAHPDLEEALAAIARDYPTQPGEDSLARRRLAGGRAQLVADCAERPGDFATARDARHGALLARVAPASALAVPLRARGVTLGVLTLAWVSAGQTYGAEDLALSEEL